MNEDKPPACAVLAWLESSQGDEPLGKSYTILLHAWSWYGSCIKDICLYDLVGVDGGVDALGPYSCCGRVSVVAVCGWTHWLELDLAFRWLYLYSCRAPWAE